MHTTNAQPGTALTPPIRMKKFTLKPRHITVVLFTLTRYIHGIARRDRSRWSERTRNKVFTFMLIVICLLALFGSALLARRNLRLGRGDRRGAMRVAIVFLVVRMLVWAFAAHHNGLAGREFNLFLTHLAFGVFLAAFLWVLYVALEPFVRKKWPGWIISWSRLLAGDYRDPLVGRDLLIGSVVGASLIVIAGVGRIAPNWIGQATPPTITPATAILDTRLFFGRFALQLSAGLFLAFICVFLLLVFVAVLRSEMLSLITLGILFTIMGMLISDSSLIMLPFSARVVISDRVCVASLRTARDCRHFIRRAPFRLLPHDHRLHRLVRARVYDRVGDLCGVGCVCGVHVRGWCESVCGEGVMGD